MHIESCVYIHVMFMFFFGLIQLINFSEDFLQIMELCVFFFLVKYGNKCLCLILDVTVDSGSLSSFSLEFAP